MPFQLHRNSELVIFGYDLNPEPWAIGPIQTVVNKKTNKRIPKLTTDLTQKQYQDALRACLSEDVLTTVAGLYAIRFTFSRQLVRYTVGSKVQTRNWADVTNLQKATEDALQGVLINNDREVISISSRLFGPQTEHAVPWVLGEVLYNRKDYSIAHNTPPTEHAKDVIEMIFDLAAPDQPVITSNEWTP